MNEIINALREGKKLRLIATVIELLQYEKVDSAVIPIPGTLPPRYIAIGTTATVAKLLEIGQGAARCGRLADNTRFRQMMQEYLMGQSTLEQVAQRIEEWRDGRGDWMAGVRERAGARYDSCTACGGAALMGGSECPMCDGTGKDFGEGGAA